MKTYVSQLVEDLRHAHRDHEPEPVEESAISFEEEMEAVENWATGHDLPPSLSQKSGLHPDQFPPPEKLDEEDLHTIMNALKAFLLSWHMEADIPEKVPLRKAYSLLVNLLHEEAWYFPTGTLHYDFCGGYSPNCELGEFCRCVESEC